MMQITLFMYLRRIIAQAHEGQGAHKGLAHKGQAHNGPASPQRPSPQGHGLQGPRGPQRLCRVPLASTEGTGEVPGVSGGSSGGPGAATGETCSKYSVLARRLNKSVVKPPVPI